MNNNPIIIENISKEFIRVSDLIRQSNKRSIVRSRDVQYASKILYPNNPEYTTVGHKAVVKYTIDGIINTYTFTNIITDSIKELNIRFGKGSIVYLSAVLELIHFSKNFDALLPDSGESDDSDEFDN